MKPTAWCKGDLVETRATMNGYKAGDVFKITDTRGIRPGQILNSNVHYYGVRLNKKTMKFDTRNQTLYHFDLAHISDKRIRTNTLKDRIKETEALLKKLKVDYEIALNYDSAEEYYKSKMKELLESGKATEKRMDSIINELVRAKEETT